MRSRPAAPVDFGNSCGQRQSNTGLNIDRWYDGRRDVIAATEAALDYLQVLYKRLGSWHLAIAAYNGGGAGSTGGKRAASEDFFQLRLPKETSTICQEYSLCCADYCT